MRITRFHLLLIMIFCVALIAVAQVLVYAYYLRRLTFKSVYQAILSLCILLVVGNTMLLTHYVGYWGSGA